MHRTLLIAMTASAFMACSDPTEQPSGGTIRLVEIGRIESVDGGPSQLSRVSGIHVDPDAGEIFVSDVLERSIRVFDRDGRLLRAWGRDGAGPGEFGGPPRFVVARDTVLVTDGQRYHFFDRDGTHLATGRIVGPNRTFVSEAAWARPNGWALLLLESDRTAGAPRSSETWYSLTPEGGIGARIYRLKDGSSASAGLLRFFPEAAPAGGLLVEADTAAYELQLIDADGGVGPRFSFDVPRVPIPDDLEALARESVVQNCARSDSPSECEAASSQAIEALARLPSPDFLPVPGRMIGSTDSTAIVGRLDLDPTPFLIGDERFFDLVHLRGERIATVEAEPGFIPYWLGANELWGVISGEYDVPVIVGYSVPPT